MKKEIKTSRLFLTLLAWGEKASHGQRNTVVSGADSVPGKAE
jgi:hypothetical protein